MWTCCTDPSMRDNGKEGSRRDGFVTRITSHFQSGHMLNLLIASHLEPFLVLVCSRQSCALTNLPIPIDFEKQCQVILFLFLCSSQKLLQVETGLLAGLLIPMGSYLLQIPTKWNCRYVTIPYFIYSWLYALFSISRNPKKWPSRNS